MTVEAAEMPSGWVGRLRRRGLPLLLVAATALLASFAISPGLSEKAVPRLGPEDVGKPYWSATPSGFKAARDYDIVDRTLTEERRQDVRASVRPVYDFSTAVPAELRRGLREALATLRHAGPEARAPSVLQTRLAFEQRLFPVEDEDFRALFAARAAPDMEPALEALLDRAYAAPVAISRDELGQSGPSGIVVRDLGDGMERTSTVAAPGIVDVREAREEMDRFAFLPGNLLPEAPPMLRRAVLRLAKRQVRPSLTINTAETERRRSVAAAAVPDAVIQVKRGQKILGDGELVSEDHLRLLAAMRVQTDQMDTVSLQLGVVAVVAVLVVAAWSFHRVAFRRRFRPSRKDGLLLAVLLVGFLAGLHLWTTFAEALHDRSPRIPLEAFQAMMPVAAGAMLVRFLLSEELALFFGLVLACLTGVMLGNSLPFAVFGLVGSLVAADRISGVKDRGGIFRAGLAVGVASAVTVFAFSLAQGKSTGADALVVAAFALVGTGLGVPVTVVALTPLLEMAFGYASDLKLLELANLNHPALKELIVQSPGTYHHSIIVGTLVEGAAEAIGANPLLARSCAYYHDIGKGKNPLYFGENQKGENPHDCLAPGMSAVIIKRHVTEGLELARQYKLPRAVTDVIAQHHGTRLVGYFHHKACRELELREQAPALDETLYRYTGPKPQFRESALVMIADAVEAASRAMAEPTRSKLQALVQRIINVVFAEGQLDECDLTLRDLNRIAESFLNTLEGIYHARPNYPPGAVDGELPRQSALALAPDPTRRAGSSATGR